MVKKKNMPNDIKDLEDMFYNPKRLTDRKKYESLLQGKFSKEQENETKAIFKGLGTCEKIPTEPYVKTFDFKIEDAKLLIEVTSINVPLTETLIDVKPETILEKIQTAVGHIEEKDSSNFDGFMKGGIVFCSTIFLSLSDIWTILENEKWRHAIVPSDLDFLIFVPDRASIDHQSSRDLYPPLAFIRNNQHMLDSGKWLPNGFHIYEIGKI